jgi:hypothetical protein
MTFTFCSELKAELESGEVTIHQARPANDNEGPEQRHPRCRRRER